MALAAKTLLLLDKFGRFRGFAPPRVRLLSTTPAQSQQPTAADVEALMGLRGHPSGVEVRVLEHAGRGLFLSVRASPVAAGTALLSDLAPLASGKDYSGIIARLLLKTSLEQVEGENKTMSLLANLVFPLNLNDQSLREEDEREISRGMREVKDFVNANAHGKFELLEVDRAVYTRLWGVCFLNALRNPGTKDLVLFSVVSLLNHSCFPSCGLRFDSTGANVSVVAINQQLEPNRQLTINYVEGQAETERWSQPTRAKYLLEHYSIACTGSKETCVCSKY